jgi:hypothetical protein
MTLIEDRLREALAATPTSTTVTDPVGAVGRRVRRARRRIAAGSGLAAVLVVAAVVVPWRLSGDANTTQRVQVGHTPSPSAHPTASQPQDTTGVIGTGVLSISSTGTQAPYLLQNTDSGPTVGFVADDRIVDTMPVERPAEQVLADGSVAWVVGNSRSTDQFRITTAYPATSKGAIPDRASFTEPGRIIDATVAAGSLFAVVDNPDQGVVVQRYVHLSDHSLNLAGSLPVHDATGIATDVKGVAWVQTGSQLIQVQPEGQQLFRLGASVRWPGNQPLYGPERPSGVWAYDGRLVGLSPSLLATGVSVAEGWRINVSGRPDAAVSDITGGVYYTVSSPDLGQGESGGIGVFYYSAAALRHGANAPTASLFGTAVAAVAVDPQGGVDVIHYGGALQRWDPAAH